MIVTSFFAASQFENLVFEHQNYRMENTKINPLIKPFSSNWIPSIANEYKEKEWNWPETQIASRQNCVGDTLWMIDTFKVSSEYLFELMLIVQFTPGNSFVVAISSATITLRQEIFNETETLVRHIELWIFI